MSNEHELLSLATGSYMAEGFDDRPSKNSLEEELGFLRAKVNLIMDAIAYNESFIAELDFSKKQTVIVENYLNFLSEKLLDYETQKDVIFNDLRTKNHRQGY